MIKKSSNFYLKAIIAFIVCCCLYSGVSAQTRPIGITDSMYVFNMPVMIISGPDMPGILTNDTGADQFDSLTVVNGSGTVDVHAGNATTTVTYTPGAGDTGVIILRYVPFSTTTGLYGDGTYIVYMRWGGMFPYSDCICVGDIANVAAWYTSLGMSTSGVWSSSVPSVASVNSTGTVILGRSLGVTTIIETFSSTSTSTTPIFVAPNPLPITGTTTTCVGNTTTLYDATGIGFWSSNDTAIATISSTGVVTGVRAGTVTITYSTYFHDYNSYYAPWWTSSYPVPYSRGGCYSTITVTILANPPITGIAPLCVGDSITVHHDTAGGTWTSGSTALATIGASSGLVRALSGGTLLITYTYPPWGCAVTGVFTVNAPPVPITGLTVVCRGSTGHLYDGSSSGAWSSSDPSVASIDAASGMLYGIAFGTATITYTITWSGCYVTTTVTVPPYIVVAPITPLATVSLCVGDTITLSDSTTGGTWSSGTTSVATISATGLVTAVGAGTTIISYYVSNLCYGDYATKSITVSAVPVISGLPTTICRGDTFTLARTPAGGTWTTTAATVASVGSTSGKVTCVSGGTAVISYTLTSGCFDTDTVRVKVPPAAIAGRDTVCALDTVRFTDSVTGGVWHSSATAVATVDSITGLVTTVTAGTAIISYTNSCGTATRTVTVTPACMCGAPGLRRIGSTGVFTSTEIGWLSAGGNFYITNNVTCNTSVTMTDCIIAMSKNTSITVAGSSGAAVLDIQGSHLFTCDSMWDGIIVSPGNRIILENSGIANKTSTMIENARIAVSISNPTTPAGYTPILGTPLILRCDGVTFNKNTIGIDVNNYVVTTAIVNNPDTLAETPSYPFVVKDAVFTSRQFEAFSTGFSAWPYVWPQNNGSAIALKAGITPVTPYDPPYYIDLKVAPPLWLSVVPCNNGKPASTGINLNGVGGTTGSLAAARYKSFVVGTATSGNYELVLFDNLCYGINAVASNLMVRNSSFEHIAATLTYGGGFGVYSSKGTSPTLFKLHIYGDTGARLSFNSFYDCATAVYGENMYYMKGRYAKMFGSPTSPCKHSYSSPFGAQAAFGYNMNSNNYYDVQLVGNTITNITTGINYLTSAPCAAAGEINISQDTVQATYTGGSPSVLYQEYVHRAIMIQNLLTGTASSLAAGSYVNVDNNTLNYVYNGIFISGRNQAGQKVTTSTNNVRVNLDVTGVRIYHQYGIQHAATTAGYIYNNTVVGPGYNTPALAMARYPDTLTHDIEAIVNSSTSNELTECNTVQDINTGFYFSGTCLNEEWINNTMINNQYGFALNGNIGNQPMHTTYSPSPKNTIGNIWTTASGFPGWGSGGGVPPFQTYTLGGYLALNSKLSVLNSAPNEVPVSNWGDIVAPGIIYAPSSIWSTTTTLYTTLQPHLACSSFLPPITPTAFFRTTSSGTPIATNNMLEDVATGQIPYPDGMYKKAKMWIAQKSVYDAIIADSAIVDSSVILRQFKSMAASSRFELVNQIGNSINTADYATAITLLNYGVDTLANIGEDDSTGVKMADDTGADNVVLNYRQYYRLLLTYIQDTLSPTDSSLLAVLANKCPIVDGPVIYDARALYSSVFKNPPVFGEGECDAMSFTSGKEIRKQAANDRQAYNLYPNPNDGKITLLQKVADNDPVNVEVWNVVGKSIYKGKVDFSSGIAKLDLHQNIPGLYVIQLSDSAGNRFTLKFTIN